MLRRPAPPAPAPIAWPSAEPVDGALRIDGRLVGGFELAPVNLELMAEGEREAALEALAALYDAVPRPFTLLSVPAARPRDEHLRTIEERPCRAAGPGELVPPVRRAVPRASPVPPSTAAPDVPAA